MFCSWVYMLIRDLKMILLLCLLLLPVAALAQQTTDSPDEETRIEELVLLAFQDTALSEQHLAQAFALADGLSSDRSAFFQVYITQCRFRIEASALAQLLEQQNNNTIVNDKITWLQDNLIKAITVMDNVKQMLIARKDALASNVTSKMSIIKNQALIDRCDFTNAWAWYSLSTISSAPDKDDYIFNADRLFTSFLGKSYNDSNMPVMVNCLYGKGLCLRDSGRYYDLITMLDNMPVDQAEVVKFARLRLAAAVKLNLSIDILNVVQDYFPEGSINRKLTAPELEMLLNCIEAVVELLKRDLPVKMSNSLKQQLSYAVELTDGYGSYWQQRLAKIIGDIDLNSSYSKLIKLQDQIASSPAGNYEQVYRTATEGLELCTDGQDDKRSEFMYMQAVSAWNLSKYDESRTVALDYLDQFDDPNRCSQLADIIVQSDLQLILTDASAFDLYRTDLDRLFASNLINERRFSWSLGCLMINSARFALAYEYFNDSALDTISPDKKTFGILLTISPLLDSGQLSATIAAEKVIASCELFTANNTSLTGQNMLDSASGACSVAEKLQTLGRNDLASQVVTAMADLPYIRQEITARITAVDLLIRLDSRQDISELITKISDFNLQHQPAVYNALIKLVAASGQQRIFNDELLSSVYKLMLSSKLLERNNAAVIRVYLAQCYYRQGNYQAYLDTVRALENQYKQYITAENYRQMALAHQKLGQYDLAVKYWSIVQVNNISMDEYGKEALYNKVLCSWRAGEFDKARQLIALAILRDPAVRADNRFIELNSTLASTSMPDKDISINEWYFINEQLNADDTENK